jgi:hypothetical protein
VIAFSTTLKEIETGSKSFISAWLSSIDFCQLRKRLSARREARARFPLASSAALLSEESTEENG